MGVIGNWVPRMTYDERCTGLNVMGEDRYILEGRGNVGETALIDRRLAGSFYNEF